MLSTSARPLRADADGRRQFRTGFPALIEGKVRRGYRIRLTSPAGGTPRCPTIAGRRFSRVCHEALTRGGAERASYLDSACGGDVDLRREVEALLAQEARAEGFLDTPPWESALAGDAGPDTPAGNPAVPDAIDVRPPLSLGARVGHYEVMDFSVGAGGMGEVYRARDTRLDRVVALKRLPPAFAADPGRVSRLAREAKTLAQLNHPGICTLHDIVVHDGVTLLVMEDPGRRDPGRPAAQVLADRGRRVRTGGPDRRRPVGRPQAGNRPPRPEARQHHAVGRGDRSVGGLSGQAGGLRTRQAPAAGRPPGGDDRGHWPGVRGRDYGARHRDWHAALHGARATRGEAGGRANRHLGAGRGPLRDARPACAVRRRLFRLPDESDSRERAAARVGRAAVGHSRARAPCRALPGEGPR